MNEIHLSHQNLKQPVKFIKGIVFYLYPPAFFAFVMNPYLCAKTLYKLVFEGCYLRVFMPFVCF